jgi:flagellar hook-associated protein 1 FlgK
MSLFGLFDIGKSAIFASQTALNVTAHNIANVNTPGFSRQEAVLSIASPVDTGRGFLGRGVTVSTIRRHYDRFLGAQLLLEKQNYGKSLALSDGFGRVEQLFNEAQGMGLSGALLDFFNAWQDVAANPEGQAQRTILLQKASDLVQTAKKIENGLENIIRETNRELEDIIERINTIASDIAALNKRIAEAGGTSNANDLVDERENLLGELAELVEFNSFEKSNGAITVIVGMKNLVDGDIVTPVEGIRDAAGDVQIYMRGSNIGQYIDRGKMGGLLALRDEIKTDVLTPFRQLIASIVDEVNQLHRNGYGLDGSTGLDFFYPADTSDIDNVIKNLAVAITDVEQVAASATDTGLPGDNGNALLIAELYNADVISNTTFEGYYSSLVASVGVKSRAASDSLRFEELLLSDIQQRRDAVSSVSLDEEAVNLIRFQRAFEAGARMITVTDELLQTVLNMV